MYLSDNYLARSSFQEKKPGYGVVSPSVMVGHVV
jgi:hypothetical protein